MLEFFYRTQIILYYQTGQTTLHNYRFFDMSYLISLSLLTPKAETVLVIIVVSIADILAYGIKYKCI